jgi:hypothetical protein
VTPDEHARALQHLAADEPGEVLRHVRLGERRVPLRLDPCGRLVYVELASGEAVSLSDANDAVGLVAMVHPAGDDGDELPCRYVRLDGVEVVEVPTPDGPLLVPSALVPYDACGGATVGPGGAATR